MKKHLIVTVGIAALTFLIGWQFGSRPKRAETPPPSAQESALLAEPREPMAQRRSGMMPLFAPSSQSELAQAEKTILQRIAQNDSTVFKLASEQVQAFLAKNRTNAESLLAAFNVTSDKELLREAARRYPGNAFVLASVLANDAVPGQRRELIEQFKQVSPDNPLGNYLLARDHSKNQQPDLALKEFAEASSKNGFHDFTVERIQGLEEMYLDAGYSVTEAKALAMTSVQLPTFSQLRDLGRAMSALERQYAGAGDTASAQALARMGLGLAANLTSAGANSLLGQIIGTVVERDFLSGLDPNATYDFISQPIGERLAQLQAQDKSIREAARFFNHWMQTANDAQLVSYFDRLKLYGEAAALDWARNQLPEVLQTR